MVFQPPRKALVSSRPKLSFAHSILPYITPRPSLGRRTTPRTILTATRPWGTTKTPREARSGITTPLWGRLASSMTGVSSEVISEQLGALRENMERGREDRRELKDQLAEMRGDLKNLQQSSTAANLILAELAKQNLGERVAQLENRYEGLKAAILSPEQVAFLMSRVKRWDAWIGGSKTFLLKVLASLLGGSVLAGLVVAGIQALLHRG